MGRKKTVYKTCEIAHLWANQVTDYATNPQRNLYFEGRSIYSYGSHYELGRLIEYKGHTIAMINDSGYSATTSKHIGMARSASSQFIRLSISESGDMADVRGALLRKQNSLIEQNFDLFSQLKFYPGFLEDDYCIKEYHKEPINQFNDICQKLGFEELMLDADDDFHELIREHVRFRLKRQETLDATAYVREAARQANIKKQLAESIKFWKRGQRELTWAERNALKFQVLRVVGSEVETSGGACVPLAHALRLLDLVERGQARVGERVGHYKFDAQANGVVTIGCHKIELSEARAVLAPYRDQKLKIVGGSYE